MTPKAEIVMINMAKFDLIIKKAKKSSWIATDEVFCKCDVIFTFLSNYGLTQHTLEGYNAFLK